MVLRLAALTVDLKAVMSAGLWDSQMEYWMAETTAEKLADETVCWTVFARVVGKVGMTVAGMVDWRVAG